MGRVKIAPESVECNLRNEESEAFGLPQDIWSPPPKARRYGLFFWWRILGLRHFFISGLLIGLALLGGVIFYNIERDSEIENEAKKAAVLEKDILYHTEELMRKNVTSPEELADQLRHIYTELQKTEKIFKNSAFYKNEGDDHLMWQYWPAVFYASNIFMTTGYGTQHVLTDRGRVITILYGFFMLPFMIVLCRDLGQWWLILVTRAYAKVLLRYRKARGIETNPKEEIAVPLSILVILTWLNLMFCGACIFAYDALYDQWWGRDELGPPMGFWDGCYFTYITISGMGMSDDVPVYAAVS
ncbi:unnamed protein product, partial [Mesorhabditis spiculigera]